MRQRATFQTVPDGTEITFKEAWDCVGFAVVYAIGYGFFFVAIRNLLFVGPLPLVSLLASLAWMAIIVAIHVSGCRSVGIRQHLINVIGHLVRNRFAEFSSDSSGESILGFGYRLGTTRHYLWKLGSKGIISVDWGLCQGVNNVWSVALRFAVRSRKLDGSHDGPEVFYDGPPQYGTRPYVFIIGPSRYRADIEAFGAGFIEFLKANRVQITLPPRELLGQVAEVVKGSFPLGKVKIGSDKYLANSLEGDIGKGAKVVVEEIRGTLLYVRQRAGPNQEDKATS